MVSREVCSDAVHTHSALTELKKVKPLPSALMVVFNIKRTDYISNQVLQYLSKNYNPRTLLSMVRHLTIFSKNTKIKE